MAGPGSGSKSTAMEPYGVQVAWMDTVQLSIRAALFVGSFLTRINLSVVPLTVSLFLTMVPGPLTHGGGRKILSTPFLAASPG